MRSVDPGRTGTPEWRARRCPPLVALLLGAAACEAPPPEAPVAPSRVEVFRCEHLLIAVDEESCTGDVVGPGELTLSFRPDPKSASWEVAVGGLSALAEACAFHGRFDQTRLSALQGRGDTDIVCPIAASVDRQYHTLSFTTREATPNTTLRIQVVFAQSVSDPSDGSQVL